MVRQASLAAVAIGITVVAGCSAPQTHEQMLEQLAHGSDGEDAGPAPDREAGIALVEAAVRASLKDPESARFTWPNGFVSGWYKPLMRHRYAGWITCGTVNAKNSYGGYVGSAAVIGIIQNGAVVYTEMDDASARYSDFVATACRRIGVPAE